MREVCVCSNLRLAGEVARSLRWSPTVQQLADRVIQGIRAGGTGQFNSVHLRIEKDARDWSLIMGGEAVSPSPLHQCSHTPGCSRTDAGLRFDFVLRAGCVGKLCRRHEPGRLQRRSRALHCFRPADVWGK